MDSLHPNARSASEAAVCAGRESAAAFWDFHDVLFERVSEWSVSPTPEEIYKGYAAELELDTDTFAACVENRETAAQVQAEYERGATAGVGGTPAFFINDWFVSGAQPFEVFQDVIERALRGESPPPTPTPLPPGATPFDANPERPGYTYGGDIYEGAADAEVALVAFVDLGSAANRTHHQDVWPAVQEKFVDPGTVRLIIKHFPAPDQVPAFLASEACECAGQQDSFSALYNLLFEKQEEWTQADDVMAALGGYVAELGLDFESFEACMDEGVAEEKVNQDLAIALQNNFPPAPQFFAFKGQQGGYAPAEQLVETIDELLAQ